MKRREFLGTLAGAAASWPLASGAQQRGLPIVAFLDGGGIAGWFEAFRQGLAERGYVSGRSVVIEFRSAAGRSDRLPDMAVDLVRLQPQIIVASGSSAAIAARNATSSIPIVFAYATDPVELGLVASLARPGGNVTGQSNQAPGLVGKRLQLLAEILPDASRFGAIWAPSFAANNADFREMQAAADELKFRLDSFEVRTPDDFDPAFEKAAAQTRGAVVMSGPLIFSNRDRIIAVAARHRLPSIYYDAEYAEAGGLISYGPSHIDLHRSAAVFVDNILKGVKPGELPVTQPTRFRLNVNMKAAHAIGFNIPAAVLARADDVIE